MKIILSSKNSMDLDNSTARALYDEMKYACDNVSVFPIMERLLAFMEA